MKKKTIRERTINAINKSMIPLEYTYNFFVKAAQHVKKSAPLVYHEIEHLIKSNVIILDKKQLNSKERMAGLGDTITTNLIRQVRTSLDEKELRKIVKDKSSQTFIDMLAKGLSVGTYTEKDYTVISKDKLFKRVLIANRGEISLRVIRACRELGVETVLIYTEPDKDSLAIKFADQAINIGPAASYLDYKKIVKVAKQAKADAIHPGYGFLAENSAFAKLCERNKIKFIGPAARTIDLLGHKVKAKKTTLKAGVPIIQGTKDPLKDKQDALRIAHEISYPVIIKAAAGGGGKGMRIVKNDADLEKAFDSAEAEAEMSFGDKTLYMEKYIEEPRHIEFQILADHHGNAVHLGERDCSIQRKHQKLIEEAPSPALDEELREKMGEAAVRIVQESKYRGAGTVEFLLDKNNDFYFIEMNTRIQVEHGVTELVTGVDLVKEQIKIAAGAKLAFSQEDIKIEGHAIECRINAEDPLENFVPSTGRILNYLPPGGPGIRINSIAHTGYKVLPDYDSLIALLICYGKDREEALSRMDRALGEYVIDGVKTTIPFHLSVLHHTMFKKGDFTTSFIDTYKILDSVKDFLGEKEELSGDQQVVLVTTAVKKYLEKNKHAGKPSAWVMAGRQEMMEQE